MLSLPHDARDLEKVVGTLGRRNVSPRFKSVCRRRDRLFHEIGIRIALGKDADDLGHFRGIDAVKF